MLSIKNKAKILLCGKTLRLKEKMLVTSIFSFSHNVFYLSQTNYLFLSTFILSFANAFKLDQSKILSYGEELWPTMFTSLSIWSVCFTVLNIKSNILLTKSFFVDFRITIPIHLYRKFWKK